MLRASAGAELSALFDASAGVALSTLVNSTLWEVSRPIMPIRFPRTGPGETTAGESGKTAAGRAPRTAPSRSSDGKTPAIPRLPRATDEPSLAAFLRKDLLCIIQQFYSRLCLPALSGKAPLPADRPKDRH